MPNERKLDPFQSWMVKQNVKHVVEEGESKEVIIATLKANGYHLVAAAVEAALSESKPGVPAA